MSVASSGPYASLHLTPDRQPCQHLTTQFFTGRMPFLLPSQQHQSTEGKVISNKKLLLHYTCLTASFQAQPGYGRYQKGKTSLDFSEVREDEVWDGSSISWTIRKQSADTNTSSVVFHRPDALPDAQPAVSECVHCRLREARRLRWRSSTR